MFEVNPFLASVESDNSRIVFKLYLFVSGEL